MLLCLDVGNTQIHGGIFNNNELKFQFRKSSHIGMSSDEIGIFLRNVLRENKIEPSLISEVAICSVVPHVDYSLKNACIKYFSNKVLFVKPGIKTGLKIRYLNPAEVGADRIANAVGARTAFPGRDLMIIDFGTATTIDIVTKEGDYLGGAIMAGAKLMVSALESKTARLPSIELVKPLSSCGQTTAESMQSGIYWSIYGGLKELVLQIQNERFANSDEKALVIGTGGLARLFEDAELFEVQIPELVLQGLRILNDKNKVFEEKVNLRGNKTFHEL